VTQVILAAVFILIWFVTGNFALALCVTLLPLGLMALWGYLASLQGEKAFHRKLALWKQEADAHNEMEAKRRAN
jgi:hypothetical protein